jgi:dihydrofolate reductase
MNAVRQLKANSQSDITIGGADLAGQAIAGGLVDELDLFLTPVVVGGGKPALPAKVGVQLDLLDERAFRSGVVHLQYRVSRLRGSDQGGV